MPSTEPPTSTSPSTDAAHPAPPPAPNGPDGPHAAGGAVALYAVDADGTGRAVTRHELDERVDRTTAAMRRLGVGPGDRVALQLPLVPEAVVALLACTRIGAVATTLTPAPRRHDPADELARRRLRRVRLLVTTGDGEPAGTGAAAPATPPVLTVHPVGGAVRDEDGGSPRWHPARHAPATGRGPSVPAPEELAAARRLGLRGPADVFWCAADLDWLVRHPLAVGAPLALGAPQVLCADPARAAHPEQLRETFDTYRVTVFHAHPDALHEVLWRSRATDPHTPDASDLRLVAPLPGLGASPAPDHWYWQQDGLPTPAWRLRQGPNPWSPPPATTGLRPGRPGTAARP
ncbi:AMP-binding protein [Kitasatospora sp. CM 4170]|uniref:AMP-binding protein n=1 Tax=Kitasatospora aburaviensis TaxID=67265 RepID=A0ABW1F3R1_9ACTN|nr:AMP-binding protein [Kitasatospora sp. CM 4170]WNM49145.1 AMP-binding protein [Kitasatospora sp. CM 4170]